MTIQLVLSTVMLALATGVCCPVRCTAEEAGDFRSVFDRAERLARDGKLDEAILLEEALLETHREDPNLLWHLGIMYAETDRHAKALESWQTLRRLEPDNWRVRAKLIQTYQARGDFEQRDREREALYQARRESSDTALSREAMYCRDQFRVAGRKVMVFEYFEPAGDRRVFLRFSVLGAGESESFWYSFGSYEFTTRAARAHGTIGQDQRIFHIDRYAQIQHGLHHAAVAFYGFMPAYDVVRARVVEALEREKTPAP